MTANPPVLVPGWTIGKNRTLALMHNNQWFRGVAVRKTGDQFSVYRVDLGDVITVPKNSLRPLPAHFCRWLNLCLSMIYVVQSSFKTFVVFSPIFKPTHDCDNFLPSRQPPGCLQCCLVGAEPKEGDVWSLDSVQVELAIICNSSSKHPCSLCRCSRSW